MARCEWVGWCTGTRDHPVILRSRAGEDRLAVCSEHLAAAEAYGYVPDDAPETAPRPDPTARVPAGLDSPFPRTPPRRSG